jgi:glucokinase
MVTIEKDWYKTNRTFGRYILAGDLGGTNTNMALFGEDGRRLTLLFKCVFPTQQIADFQDPLSVVLDEIRSVDPRLQPSIACISVAGPAHDNFCRLTNAGWAVDGAAITKTFGIETRVINDFLALSYAVPLLDLENEEQIVPLPHSDGSLPRPGGDVMAVLGAGTGLGTSFLVRHQDGYHAYPAEGGHSDFSAYDDQTIGLKRFVEGRYAYTPGAEAFVAGRGIAHIFNYRKSTGMKIEGILEEIDNAPDSEKPERIAKAADKSRQCREIMRLHISIYARYAARVALMYLPTEGLFIAGGIAAKNLPLFVEGEHFMKVFEYSYKENIHEVLMTIPVYVVRDYSLSLYGAANAARAPAR